MAAIDNFLPACSRQVSILDAERQVLPWQGGWHQNFYRRLWQRFSARCRGRNHWQGPTCAFVGPSSDSSLFSFGRGGEAATGEPSLNIFLLVEDSPTRLAEDRASSLRPHAFDRPLRNSESLGKLLTGEVRQSSEIGSDHLHLVAIRGALIADNLRQ
jgi:hypothetical protein